MMKIQLLQKGGEEMKETCINPFIRGVQQQFAQGGTLREAMGSIERFQRHAEATVKNINPKCTLAHAVGMSTVALGGAVLYEYVRAHGGSFLPNACTLVGMLPVASVTRSGEANIATPDNSPLITDENTIGNIWTRIADNFDNSGGGSDDFFPS